MSRDPVWAKFVRGVFSSCKHFFRISLQVKKHVRRNVNPETVMIKKNHLCPGYVATIFFFFFFRTRKKAYYHRKKQNTKSWIPCESLPPTPKRGRGVECRIAPLPLPPPALYPSFCSPPRKGCAFFYPVDNGCPSGVTSHLKKKWFETCFKDGAETVASVSG